MPACELKPSDKKVFIRSVGQELVRTHGKQKFYKTTDVRRAVDKCGYPVDWSCWAYCMFSEPLEFKALHDAAGEACDYAAMKAEVLTDLAGGPSFSLLDIDLSWLDWPDIDLSFVFDWIDVS